MSGKRGRCKREIGSSSRYQRRRTGRISSARVIITSPPQGLEEWLGPLFWWRRANRQTGAVTEPKIGYAPVEVPALYGS
jgi:hypothetical protein